VAIVKILVNCHCAPCSGDNGFLNTPLIIAAFDGDVEMVRVLLEGGADVQKTNNYQNTALHIAAFLDQLEVCRLLLDWGVNINPLNERKWTPLHYAAANGNLALVQLLVEKGADVGMKEESGDTARDVALYSSHGRVADWLASVSRV
jgi:ankyrin repeat protein